MTGLIVMKFKFKINLIQFKALVFNNWLIVASNNIDFLKGPLIFVTPKSLNLVPKKILKNKKKNKVCVFHIYILGFSMIEWI
jgi:hypothetical protein